MKTKIIILFTALVSLVCAQAPRGEIELGTLGRGGSWKFNAGPEFPGAEGVLDFQVVAGRAAGVVTFDFTKGGNYVAAFTGVNVPEGYSEIRFRAKSDGTDRMAVRLRDSSGQYHQFGISYSNKGDWQDFRVPLDGKKSPLYFHGAKDGRIYFPITQVWILINRPTKEPKYGEVVFSEVKALP